MVAIIILAAGQGKRMASDLPKILHSIGGKSIVHHVMDTALALQSNDPSSKTVVVVSPTIDSNTVKNGRVVDIAIQTKPLGTGDAVRAGLEAFAAIPDTVLILCGDTPLLEGNALASVIKQHKAHKTPTITVVGMRPINSGSYGRIVADPNGQINKIVEYRDASEQEQTITLCNSGVIVADGALLKRLLTRLSPQNEAGEYYLTDIVALAKEEGIHSHAIELPADMLQGINTRVDLAAAEQTLQQKWRQKFMEQGVTLIDPESVFFSYDTQIGRDVTLYPNITFGLAVKIGNRVHILPNCHIEKSIIGNDVTVGPFAHLREGVVLGDQVSIGNFVELKSTTMGADAKAKHLSYLGNAIIGDNVNIGAGTITCNHNGFVKSQTKIGDNAYIGSNSSLVAPVSIGQGAMVAAGSVVNEDVPDDALAIARKPQENKLKWASAFRARHK
jgi:bifunctional UDP-N-acetylglucosamine pyrophosphorylase/glucosamine-1-phosphate N-acetyltransferase